MTTPAVRIYRNMTDLRKGWREWIFAKNIIRWGMQEGFVYYTADGWDRFISGDAKLTAAEAAQALAERLVAAGYEPKEK